MSDRKYRIIVSCLVLISVISYGLFFYQKFFAKENSNDEALAFYSNNTWITSMPAKNTGYTFSKGVCNNGASVTFDAGTWAPTFKNLTSKDTKCTLYFTK